MAAKQTWLDHADMNRLSVPCDDGPRAQIDYSMRSKSTDVSVIFKGHLARLVASIQRSDVVLGCVAWLTHPDILAALAGCRAVSIVVQKEDLLRPDVADDPVYAQTLRAAYDRLPTIERFEVAPDVSGCGDPTLEAVRCVGMRRRDGRGRLPIGCSHHKFVVFCRLKRPDIVEIDVPRNGVDIAFRQVLGDYEPPYVEPYAVWTGSFNFTRQSVKSFENALYIQDAAVARAYYEEYKQILVLSEPLDWTSEYAEPQWRIGT